MRVGLFLLAAVAAFAPPTFRLPARPARQIHTISDDDRERLVEMLGEIHRVVKSNYYDPTFHGLDFDQRFKTYRARLGTVKTVGAGNRVIAAFLAGLHDSHTFYYPPQLRFDFYYGFRMQMIGGRCFITEVRPDSDAARFLRPGDEVVRLQGYSVNDGDFEPLSYDLYTLEPQASLHFELKGLDGRLRSATVATKFVKRSGFAAGWPEMQKMEALYKERSQAVGKVFVWKIPEFSPAGITDKTWKLARDYGALVIDLRGDPGGSLDTLQTFLDHFLPPDTEIETPQGRTRQHPVVSKKHGPRYTGKVVVLLDSQSASAAEIFARTMQLQHRGIVVGARSAGAVMESEIRPVMVRLGGVCGVSVTVADVLMSDGHSLENVGVTPDVAVEPTARDLAEGRDPALAKAVELAGGTLDPAAAGKMFPFVWRPYKTTV